ncbi:uncharacterized protein CANTADRAFT_7444 [Suhomyces tanzawaensis NRRL Y-17324]|uniref:Protein MON2 n=1 Tax=Suhomyces tanzawaensis NRRL Y-17324 TaxID=984487 RepID=A0A1E4SEM7_9ASCO|nr:uncharacterized protein CANTADRAFT_7444 [Suhomyces tanzawaensis NRRL Y-17324]ODV77974.1 hypothetical protein CANTADRAFT_7444 [Suhomyces tanzawaensis NRRL Y-17324]
MATVNQLVSGLSNLATESKRRHADIKTNCDSLLANLKQYPPTASISEISPNHRNDLIIPFIKAVKTGNAKAVTISIPVIHQLIVTRLVPLDRLDELLEGLKEASNLAVDIQLRILQCLPTLMQTYGAHVKGDTLINLLRICSSLTTSNKPTVVINTASAMLQQVFSNVFDEERANHNKENPEKESTHSVTVAEGATLEIPQTSYESFEIFQDLCHLIENEKPTYLKDFAHIKTTSILEIVENVIATHKKLFNEREELSYLLRVKLIPSLLRILSSTIKSFPLVTRTMRVILVLLSSQLNNLEIESEVILSFLNHILLNEPTEEENVPWEKILVLELYKGLFSDFNVIKSIFEKYDNDEKKKDVIQELNSILITYLQNNSILTPNQSLKQPLGPLYISKSSSHMKISILDHLDKMEPPHSIPATYPIYLTFNILLLYSEGIANFVQNLSSNSNPTTLEADVEFTNFFIEASYPNISSLFELFIYYDMDNESFHLLVRSLQRFTHSTGLLGLGELRDGLLMIISKAIIKSEESKDRANGSSLQEQGLQLLAFGESLVESLTSIQPVGQENSHGTDGEPQSSRQSMESTLVHIRNFNSRHITCVRALANLGVSLGSTLGDSWKIIWMTFQWCDFFVYGADTLNSNKTKATDDSTAKLTSQDYANLESSKKKLIESVNDFPTESFKELLNSLIELSDQVLSGQEIKFGSKEATLVPCPYNKSFYLSNIISVCSVNPNKYLINDDSIWKMWCEYIIRLGTQRTMNYNTRIHVVQAFNTLIQHITSQGFNTDINEIIARTASKSLNGINSFLNGILNLGVPKELLVLNCETEIHHLCLSTLYELIDKYEVHYKNSWNIVFEILDTPFKTTSWYNEDKNLREKMRLLIDSSFRTLKLILDEFMSTLPFSQLKLLIDTLHNFCSQTFDLNTSFSSVSYFWLISDSLKLRITEAGETTLHAEKLSKVATESQLISLIGSTNDDTDKENYVYYIALDIYLLSTLVKLSLDQRDQVRDGSIQTFFQIIDVHGSYLSSSSMWDLVYKVVLQPVLLDLKVDLKDAKYHKKEWLESFGLILSGIISIFNKFMMDFDSIGHIYDKWEVLIKYFDHLLSFKWLDLNMKIFRSFQDLLLPFTKLDASENTKNTDEDRIKKLLFDFWVHVPVEYDFINPQNQNSAAALMECFPALYKITSDRLSEDDVKIIILLINKCARYPLLPEGNQLDDKRPTKLQKSTIDNLRLIQIADKEIESQVIQQLSGMTIYPFGIKKRIEQKLDGNKAIISKYKIPSFVAISHLSTQLLKEKLENFSDFGLLLKDKGAAKIIRSLLEIISKKFVGIVSESKPLWVEANEILVLLIRQIIAQAKESVLDEDLWNLIMKSVVICLEDRSNIEEGKLEEVENIKIEQYNQLTDLVLPKLLESNNEVLIDGYLKSVYENSFLYAFDHVDESIIDSLGGSELYIGDGVITSLTNYDFNNSFGSTKPIERFSNQHTRFRCLQELIHYSVSPVNLTLNGISQKYLLCRISFCLRRFISEERLLFLCPISRLQEQEVVAVLRGWISVEWTEANGANARKLHRLLVQMVRFASRVRGLDGLMEKALK